jgi:NAD-dependent SIR2 family protein deacetylase
MAKAMGHGHAIAPIVDAATGARALHEWLSGATHVLIGAGAGMTAAAGIDYGDEADFERTFPVLHSKGFQARYEFIGYDAWTPAEAWAFWATHVHQVRWGVRDDAVYRALRTIIGGRDHFVVTSNVDGLFARNGFDEERIFTPQGDYALMQCRLACTQETWPSHRPIKRAIEAIDPNTFTITDPEAIPVCPRCGGPTFMNVRADEYFIEAPYEAQADRFAAWVQRARTGRLLLIEIGAGFNTPSVIRWRMESIMSATPDARFVRINPQYPHVSAEFGSRAVSIGGSAAETLCPNTP